MISPFLKRLCRRLAQIRAGLPEGTPIELWWQDQARIAQQTKLTRRWARRGTRPSAPRDQRRSSAWIFGAICPAEGKAAGIVMPRCNSEAMSMHLEEIAFHVAPGAHAIVILDQAGWHGSAELVVPSNITLLPLPPRCPELNPVENIWQFMRDNWLSNRMLASPPFGSNPTTTSSTTAASPGTTSSISHRASCPSDCDSGRRGPDHCALV